MSESAFSSFASYPLVKQLALATSTELVAAVQGIFQFDVTQDGKTLSLTVDLKNGSGRVAFAASDDPDATFKVSDADFARLIAKDTDPTELFMEGKLKIGGDMGMAMKFSSVLDEVDLDAKPAASAPASQGNALQAFKVGQWLDILRAGLAANPSAAAQMPGEFVFRIKDGPNGQSGWFVIDTKASPPALTAGTGSTDREGDCGFALSDENCTAMFNEDVQPEEIFMEGKLKLSGDMGLAMQFKSVLEAARPQSKL